MGRGRKQNIPIEVKNKIIEDDVYPRSYIRFLKEGGFSFAVSDKKLWKKKK